MNSMNSHFGHISGDLPSVIRSPNLASTRLRVATIAGDARGELAIEGGLP